MAKGQRKFLDIMKKRPLILDGATGTELQKRGMPAGVCPELWCIENPLVIGSVHGDYARAGSDVVYTCTFGANRFKLGEYGDRDARSVNRRLALIAKEALRGKALIAGDVGPTGHFIQPFGEVDFEEAVAAFKEQVLGLLEGGVDCFVIETMMDIQEARAALIAVKESCDLFTMVTMTFERDGRTLNGTDPLTALTTLQSLGADAVGCNCSTGPDDMVRFIGAMKPYAKIPLIAKPNAGLPKTMSGTTVYDMDAAEFASRAVALIAAGAGILGGCCGTTPQHLAALRKAVSRKKPTPPLRKSLAALSSARRTLLLEPGRPLAVIGEGINPTGRKALQEELREGKTALARQMARDQEAAGAALLDVNVGVPGIDQEKAMQEVVLALSAVTELPLVIDSAKAEPIERALRVYPGRALINSISGEKEKLKKLLPVAAKYGAMFILLPLTDKGIPETAEKRAVVVRAIEREARKHGFTRDDFLVDGIVMTAASNPKAPLETIRTVRWATETFGARTVVGLSNVSFGMPERKWINTSFLAMAAASGLTAAIANPASDELMFVKRAADVLGGRDRDAAAWIAHCAKAAGGKKGAPIESLAPERKVREAILGGNREAVAGLVGETLKAGFDAAILAQEIMIPAIVEVGERFGRKEYFLPQLIASGETMKIGMEALDPFLKEGLKAGARDTILIATVKGDIHDIGKNIVALMLRNHGYQVVDLGKDVAAERIVREIERHRPRAVGLSALMTTTMTQMKEVIGLARKQGEQCPFVVGGAVVTKAYAESIGAEYARDGVEAVSVIQKITGERLKA
jgi:5-methyltetrahydrofolate--homocysteine methyltransferase